MRSLSMNAARRNAADRGDTTSGSRIISNVAQAAERLTAATSGKQIKRGIQQFEHAVCESEELSERESGRSRERENGRTRETGS